MKRIIAFLILVFSAAFVYAADQKDIATQTLKVEGNCNMCKKRIEDAAYIKGVKRAEWDKESKMLTVVYRPSKTDVAKIEKSISGAGHNTEHTEAAEAD